MARTRLYTIIYVALMGLAIGKVAFEATLPYGQAMLGIFAFATIKTFLIAAYYQHLKWEPRSVTFVMLLGTFGVFLLTVAATFSLV